MQSDKSNGRNGWVELRDLGITVKMRGKAKQWGKPTTLTIVYKPSTDDWFASFTVEVPTIEAKFGSQSNLEYESIISYDLGIQTALTTYDGKDYVEISNPRFIRNSEKAIKHKSKRMRRKIAPNKNKKPSKRWKKANKEVSKLQRKIGNQRKNWQHQVTSDIARRYDIGVTEELNVKGMTRKAKKGSKRKKQKAGLNNGTFYYFVFNREEEMLEYNITLTNNVTEKLKALGNPNWSKPLKQSAAYMERITLTRFAKEIDPDGKKWTPLKPETIRRKKSGVILREKSILINATSSRIVGDVSYRRSNLRILRVQ